MPHRVLLTEDAESDLETLYEYVALNTSVAAADRVLDRLLVLAQSLASSPDRGNHPGELLALGIRTYRQVLLKPWRVIYRVVGQRVVILLIADGRRDMRTLLAQRLLNA